MNQTNAHHFKQNHREESCPVKKYEANPLWQFYISYTFDENLSVLITPTITAPRD